MTTSIPLFLSSNRVSSSTSEAAFSQQLKPPLSIPDGAKAVRCYVDSATIPYSFPNVSSTTSRVVVRVPLSTAPSTQSANVTLELPTGVYDLTEIAEQLNLAVNTWLHTNGYPVLTGSWQYYDFRSDAVATKTDAANFCSLLPDFHANRVQLTLNYDHSAIDFDPTTGSDTTLDDLLGFTSLCERTVEAQVTIGFGGYTLPASFCTVDVGAGGTTPEWKNVTLVVPPGTYSRTTLCTAINSAFVTAVNALPQASKFNPTVPAATATGPLIASISLEASTEVTGQYRVDFAYANYGNPFSFTAGTAVIGSYDGAGTQTNTPAELQQGIDLLGSWDYYQTQDNYTLATMWSGAQTTPFTAENAATIDRVTEIGIACPGLAHGSYGSGGSSSGATLARFQVTGSPGTNMVYRPTTPLKIDASHLIGARLQDVNVALVDQHGVGLTSLLGEKYSVVLVVEYDM